MTIKIIKAFFARLKFGLTSDTFKGRRLKIWKLLFMEYDTGDDKNGNRRI